MKTPFAILLLLGALLACAAPSFATTWTIDPDGSGDWPTIQTAIDSSAAGDTILLGCGTFREHDLVLPFALTFRSLTGDPGCATIDPQGAGRVFFGNHVTGVRIEGITMNGGAANGTGDPDNEGGALHFRYSDLAVQECVFLTNSASGVGGAVYFLNSTASVRSCYFGSNQAGSSGEAGALYASANTNLTVTDCDFISNQAYNGGAIRVGASAPPSRFVRCLFQDNHAAYRGGAVFATSGQGTITEFEDCVFLRNSADFQAGTFFAVFESGIRLTGCTLAGNESNYGASGVALVAASSLTAERTIFAFGPDGDAVNCDATSQATLTCCDIYGNAGGDWVGCIAGQEGLDGNFSSDPVFCDLPAGDLTLSAGSACLDAPGCGLVGALGEGCGTTGTEATSWGAIKASFR